MKVIKARCNECGKTFKCYGKNDGTLASCNVHPKVKKDKK